jgi:hypothetical protein
MNLIRPTLITEYIKTNLMIRQLSLSEIMATKLEANEKVNQGPKLVGYNYDMKGKGIAADSVRLYNVYSSGRSESGQPLDWAEKLNKKGVVVHSSAVEGSTWMAIKATTKVSADVASTRRFLLDDANIGSFDDMFDCCDVCTYDASSVSMRSVLIFSRYIVHHEGGREDEHPPHAFQGHMADGSSGLHRMHNLERV